MSQSKMDRRFPVNLGKTSDSELANLIALALREDFGDTPSSIKRIGQITSANLRAIKNWYEAKNMPSSRHLLMLARSSPGLFRFILLQIGGEDLWDVIKLLSSPDWRFRHARAQSEPRPQIASNNVTSDVTSSIAAQRQAWFLERVASHPRTNAATLTSRWAVNLRTARRDISILKRAGKLEFVGPRHSGFYKVM